MVKHEGTQSVLWGANVLEKPAGDGTCRQPRPLHQDRRSHRQGHRRVEGAGSVVTIGEGLDKAVQGAFTRPSRSQRGRRCVTWSASTRAVPGAWPSCSASASAPSNAVVKNQIKKPRPELADRLEREVRMRWQPQVRAKAKQTAATTGGIMIDVQARFGYTAAPGSTDDARIRHLTLALPHTTPPASSRPRRPVSPRTSSARSPPRPWARSTSATTATAPTASKSNYRPDRPRVRAIAGQGPRQTGSRNGHRRRLRQHGRYGQAAGREAGRVADLPGRGPQRPADRRPAAAVDVPRLPHPARRRRPARRCEGRPQRNRGCACRAVRGSAGGAGALCRLHDIAHKPRKGAFQRASVTV
ncbi:telomere-protecting terminal protein Tpg [Streptomyces nigra]